jgi:hypothetical protein
MMPHHPPAATPWSARLVDRLAVTLDRRHRPARGRLPGPTAAAEPTAAPLIETTATAAASPVTGTAIAVLERPPATAATVDAPGVEVVPEVDPPVHDDRRSFLFKAALVGTALAVGPGQFLLRPGTAYASVCGDAAECNQGWTAFCCTINGGANTCPPGSYAAGWWKVDGSAFCGGAARYIVDCNRLPWASCTCRCASGTCDRRRVCCNNFRYGQCNLQIAGVTPVVCRVIVCTPPWVWDRACTTTSRTDNRTATHSAPCLPGPGASPVQIRYQDLGMVGSYLGRQLATGTTIQSGLYGVYERGVILYKPGLGARVLYPAIDAGYSRLRREHGFLGFPTSDELPVGDNRGLFADFEFGRILAAPGLAAVEVHGAILARYNRLGGPRNPLVGYPLTDELDTIGGGGRISRFEGGGILWNRRTGVAAVVYGQIWLTYLRHGGVLGFPTTEELDTIGGTGRISLFEGGGILWNRRTGFAGAVYGQIWLTYLRHGREGGILGLPATDELDTIGGTGRISLFDGGGILWNRRTGFAGAVYGEIWLAYLRLGRESGLGFPTTGIVELGDGRQQATFERGTLTYDPATGVQGP